MAMLVDGSSPTLLFKPAPIILVFGGTLAASAAGFMKTDISSIKDVIKQAFGVKVLEPKAEIERMMHLAEVARREGLLALEKAATEIEDPFFKKGIEMTVDGVDSEEIEATLEGDIEATAERHKMGAKFFSDMGGFSPTLGIIGTVVGLIHVLANLNNPNEVGPAISSAFTATLWGILAANLLWIPISNKLKRATEIELHMKKMILDGLLAVQAGSSPRTVQARLQSYLASTERENQHGGEAAA
jgi:chemotaxis protein MotA